MVIGHMTDSSSRGQGEAASMSYIDITHWAAPWEAETFQTRQHSNVGESKLDFYLRDMPMFQSESLCGDDLSLSFRQPWIVAAGRFPVSCDTFSSEFVLSLLL